MFGSGDVETTIFTSQHYQLILSLANCNGTAVRKTVLGA